MGGAPKAAHASVSRKSNCSARASLTGCRNTALAFSAGAMIILGLWADSRRSMNGRRVLTVKENTEPSITAQNLSQTPSSFSMTPWNSVPATSWCTIPQEGENAGGAPDPPEETPEGFFYVKVKKSASSTTAGVAYRIAHRVGARVHGNPSTPCHVFARHSNAQRRNYGYRGNSSFLWSFVRDPSSRILSHYYFQVVSRKREPPSGESFVQFASRINKKYGGYTVDYLKTHHQAPMLPIDRDNVDEYVQSIMQEYDFLGVVERFDESMVALQLILHLHPGDVLYFKAKVGGDGEFDDSCNLMVKPVMLPAMKRFLDSNLWTDEWSIGDFALHRAVNQKLDATIASLGKERFDKALNHHRALQQRIHDVCKSEVVFPCTNGTNTKALSKSNCYFNDNGCGYPCIDRLLLELEGQDVGEK